MATKRLSCDEFRKSSLWLTGIGKIQFFAQHCTQYIINHQTNKQTHIPTVELGDWLRHIALYSTQFPQQGIDGFSEVSLIFSAREQMVFTCRQIILNYSSIKKHLSYRWSNQAGKIILTTSQSALNENPGFLLGLIRSLVRV